VTVSLKSKIVIVGLDHGLELLVLVSSCVVRVRVGLS